MHMRRVLLVLSLSLSLFAQSPLAYPQPLRTDFKENYFGVQVSDPYRWMEDLSDPNLAQWIEQQNKLTFDFLNNDLRTGIVTRLTELSNYEKFSAPNKIGSRYFYSYNSGLQPHSILYFYERSEQDAKVLLDPGTFSQDGTVSLGGTSISPKGTYIAYATSDGGSDWRTWYIRNVSTQKDLTDKIEWSKFSGATWTKNESGFFYARYDTPPSAGTQALKQLNQNQKIYFHKLNTPQSADILVHEDSTHPQWGFSTNLTEDGRYLLLYQTEGTQNLNRVFFKELKDSSSRFIPIFNDFDAEYSFVFNLGTRFYFKTNKNAPLGRIIEVDISNPKPQSTMHTLVTESASGALLQDAEQINNALVISWLKDSKSEIDIFSLRGVRRHTVQLPSSGSIGGISGNLKDKNFYFSFASFNRPSTIYKADSETARISLYKTPKLGFDPELYITNQVFVPSFDGTLVPAFITHKKGLKLDGKNPTLLYAYGGFNITQSPSFSPTNLLWMEQGGIYVLACLRGGGEYGSKWYDAGRLEKKQNVFDDFISVAEWLVKNNYTNSKQLAIRGGSNGGLLVGAVMTQRPELFGACIPQVGVMDMLRYHKFTIGWAWKSDYMSSETEAGFKNLMTYSPLHTIKSGVAYPPTLITTADRDDRVFPAHSFKFGAEMQYAQSGSNRILIRVQSRAGHGAGKSTQMTIEEQADILTFLTKTVVKK